MSSLRTLLLSASVTLLLSSAAFAQTKQYDKDADLPVEKPELKLPPAPPKPPEPPTTPPEGPPPTIYGKDLATESGTIVYVLDISGSMDGDAQFGTLPDGSFGILRRIHRAKQQLGKSITSLPKNFKFNVLAYDCDTRWFDNQLVPADEEHKAKAIAWVNALIPSGGTGTGPAVVWALLYRTNKLVVLLTDGAPNCGAGPLPDPKGGTKGTELDPEVRNAHLSQIRGANTQSARIDVFGIKATGDFRAWCIECAAQNGGSYTDVR